MNKTFAQARASVGLGPVAQELGKRERTEDVVTGASRDKTFQDLMLSQPVLEGLR